jgi:hypothetical protein
MLPAQDEYLTRLMPRMLQGIISKWKDETDATAVAAAAAAAACCTLISHSGH